MYKVLIVDDEIMIRRGLSKIIHWEEIGFEMAGAVGNAMEALELIKKTPVDVLLTDISMPEMTGLELIHQARKILPGLKAVVISGYSEFDYAREAIELKVENYILKPVVPDELSKTLTSLIGQLDAEKESFDKQENQKLFLLQYSLQLAISGNFDSSKAEPFILEQFSSFRYLVMFTFKNDFLVHKSEAFFDNLRSTLTPDGVFGQHLPRAGCSFYAHTNPR